MSLMSSRQLRHVKHQLTTHQCIPQVLMANLPPLGPGTQTSLCSGLVLHLKYFFLHILRDELSHVWLDLLLVNLSFLRLMMESFLKCKCIIG